MKQNGHSPPVFLTRRLSLSTVRGPPKLMFHHHHQNVGFASPIQNKIIIQLAFIAITQGFN